MSSDQSHVLLGATADVSDVAVILECVSKHYQIYDKPHHRLLQSFSRGRKKYYNEFVALSNVSFCIKRGETVGIIGRNGAGKSTLLQIICGTLTPTSGSVKCFGTISALLELGAGFNHEFTGYENIYLYGSILGIPTSTIDDLLPSILDFAEIGEHIGQPVKTYSSGMFVRLAFSVAIMLEPDILIIDEALAVGDIYFQRKCHARLKEYQENGGSLLLVTHSTDSLINLCHRGIVIESGHLIYDGDTKSAVAEYMKTVFGSNKPQSGEVSPVKVNEGITYDELVVRMMSDHEDRLDLCPGHNQDEVRLGRGGATVADCVNLAEVGQPLMVESGGTIDLLMKYVFHEAQEKVIFGIMVRDIKGSELYACNTYQDKNTLYSFDASEILLSRVSLFCPLSPGRYFITIGISKFDHDGQHIEAIDRRVDALVLTVLSTGSEFGGVLDMRFSFNSTSLIDNEGD